MSPRRAVGAPAQAQRARVAHQETVGPVLRKGGLDTAARCDALRGAR